jgi:hypothetical protein
MPTSEEVGQAIERQQLNQAFGQAIQSPYASMDSDSALTDVQLNQKLMRPEWESNKLKIMRPQVEEEEVWVCLRDEEGKPIMRNGKKVVDLEKVRVFKGWEQKEVEVPGGNLFKSDLRTAISDDTDILMLNRLMNLYFYIIELSMATGEDYSFDLYKLYNLIGSVLNTSNTRYGKTLEMIKTQISKGVQESTIRQALLQDRRGGLFDRFRKKVRK